MASSYGKRTWFHELVGLISLLSMIACFLMLDHKPCQIPLIQRNELDRWSIKSTILTGTEISTKLLREKNQTSIANEIELFIENYYDHLQLFHITIGCWSIIIMLLGLINIVPRNEDFKVMTILFMVIMMGFAALFAFYTAFLAFHKPCRALTLSHQQQQQKHDHHHHHHNNNNKKLKEKEQEKQFHITRANLRYLRYYYKQLQEQHQQNNNSFNQLNNQNNKRKLKNQEQEKQEQKSNGLKLIYKKLLSLICNEFLNDWNININNPNNGKLLPLRNQLIFMLEFRSLKDKRPINVFEDDDDIMIRITLINSSIGFILLCSDFLFFFDSRQHMIEWRN